MAMIDYGALLRVKGNNGSQWQFVNKDADLFMSTSDTGYVCDTAEENGAIVNIRGNYFVYAGDEELLLVFYKQCVKVISHGKVIDSFWESPFISETRILNNNTTLCISHLDPSIYVNPYEIESWKDYVKDNWRDADGTEPLSDLEGGYREYRKFFRHTKRLSRINRNGGWYKYRTNRYLAKWEHAGKQYEVIFGYGIDPKKEVWERVKTKAYDFSGMERKLIDSWFE